MDHTADRRAVVQAVFVATGKKIDEDDPIVVAALFHAFTMRQASEEAASRINEAGLAAKGAVDDVRDAAVQIASVARKMAADAEARSKALEGRVRRAVREGCQVQSGAVYLHRGWLGDIRGVFIGIALGVALAAGGLSAACGFSFSWVHDARLGAEFRRVIPTLEPSFRDKLIDHLEKRGS